MLWKLIDKKTPKLKDLLVLCASTDEHSYSFGGNPALAISQHTVYASVLLRIGMALKSHSSWSCAF